MITLEQYWMGRDKTHQLYLTTDIIKNALVTVDCINLLIEQLNFIRIPLEIYKSSGTIITSGWRPPTINENIPTAAPRSKHITGQACDIYDPEGDIDEWLMANLPVLESIGLWMEHPLATKTWTHLQTVPPKSGKRVFFP